jgi:ubiquinol-cytochrome c reductase cytochrome b subunit
MTTAQTVVNPAVQFPKQLEEADKRYHLSAGMRRQINKVFPTHWSFMLGEIALYSFVILILSGVYLTLFFKPSMAETVYHGVYQPLSGVRMTEAFASSLDLSFEVRGGLFMRQIHHWAALLFLASMAVHMMRIFFTGAFRRPREANWFIGCALFFISMFEGYFGYGLPDDLLSGTGIRAAMSGIVLGLPLIGTWVHWGLYGGDFPGNIIIPRLYILHVLVFPGIILALIGVHLALVWYQKHTQFPGPGRTENNVVGVRILPVFALKAGAFFALVFGVLAIMSGIFQINPVWTLGPYNPAQVSAGSQPDWYLGWTDGMLRIFPAWETYIGGHTIPQAAWAAISLGAFVTPMVIWPILERKFTGDDAHHNILQRPRDTPVRTGVGAMMFTVFVILTAACGNDIIALKFDISLNATTWFFRIALVVGPIIAYYATYRFCLGLQRSDRAVLEHGIETGILRRLPHGEYIEVHQPLGPVDEHGHPLPLEYQGATVPKKMNQLGSSGAPGRGSFLTADPVSESEALTAAEHESEHHALEAIRKIQEENANGSNGHFSPAEVGAGRHSSEH